MLFLVSGPPIDKPGLVTIYGAIDWGWRNQTVPEPATVLLFGAGLPLLYGARRLSQRQSRA
jgi:hypothetical protein